MKLHKSSGIFLALFLFNIAYAYILGRNPLAILFACYMWLPFFIGLLLAIFNLEDSLFKYSKLLWLVALAGVLINSQIAFPWVGQTYEVLGKTVDASRNWYAGEFSRISGFARINSIACLEISLPCIILLCSKISPLKKAFIWALSIIGVYLTTSKITLLLMLIAPIMVLIAGYAYSSASKNTNSNNSFKKVHVKRFILPSVFIASLLVVVMPILTLTQRSNSVNFENMGFFSLFSLYDRMSHTWPNAWKLLTDDAAVFPIVFGRGLGGVGTPQTFFEVSQFNPADNLFMYLYLIFGIFSLLFFWYILIGIGKWPKSDKIKYLIYYGITIFTLLSGITSNGIESPYQLIITGLLIGKATQKIKVSTTTIST